MGTKNLTLLMVFFFLFSGSSAVSAEIKGMAWVIDGDTIVVNHQKIRLFGIDAPEISQICADNTQMGRKAKTALIKLVKGRTVSCTGGQIDSYGRIIAQCFVYFTNQEYIDISAKLVQNGMAFAYRKYSKIYIHNENIAKNKNIGIWERECMKPETFRRESVY
tara:strand:+ start:25 stop:513 length:489 start_codon:yes stop_codon:yes gene_type:complete